MSYCGLGLDRWVGWVGGVGGWVYLKGLLIGVHVQEG